MCITCSQFGQAEIRYARSQNYDHNSHPRQNSQRETNSNAGRKYVSSLLGFGKFVRPQVECAFVICILLSTLGISVLRVLLGCSGCICTRALRPVRCITAQPSSSSWSPRVPSTVVVLLPVIVVVVPVFCIVRTARRLPQRTFRNGVCLRVVVVVAWSFWCTHAHAHLYAGARV